MGERGVRWAIATVLAGWLMVVFSGAPVAAAGVRLEVSAGFDRLARSGAWLPVRVTLTNDGPDIEVVVRVQRRGSDGGRLSVSQAVELPTGTRKEVTLLLLVDRVFGPLTVQVLDGTRPLAEQQVEVNTLFDRLTGVLASSPEGATRVIAGLGARGGVGQIARLSPDDLPTNPHALAGLDALVINGVSTRALTPDQVSALGRWVADGGTLVLGGGGGAPGVLEGLASLAPVRLTGSAAGTPRLPGLETMTGAPVETAGPFVVAAVAPTAEATVLAAQGETPLVVARSIGRGRVVFVALDLGLDPFLGWTGSTRFWETLLGPTTPTERGAGHLLETGMRLRWPLGSGTALDLPAVGALALLLLGYVLAVGPLNYLVLRRFDRREWAWLTTPVLTLLFTGALFGIGAGARGGQVAVNTLSIVYSTEGAPGAAVESYIGVFSPGRATHTLRLPAGTLLSSLPDEGRGPDPALPAQDLWQGPAVEARDLPFAAAEFKTFVAQGGVRRAPIESDLRLAGDRLVGTVRNTSETPLLDTRLLIGQQLQPLGTIAPGAGVTVDWRAPERPAVEREDLPLAARLNAGRFPAGGQQEDWREQARFQVVEAAFSDGADRGLTSGVHVLGWLDATPLPLTIPGVETRQQALTLVTHTAAVRVQPGPVTLSPGLLPRQAATAERFGPERFGPTTITFPPGAETVVDFLVPAGMVGLEAEELTLLIGVTRAGPGLGLPPATAPGGTAGAAAGPAPTPTPTVVPGVPIPPRPVVRAGAVQFALWDYRRQTWAPLPHAGEGRVVVPNAAAYVSSTGPIRLRVSTANAGEPLWLRQLDLGLRGRLP